MYDQERITGVVSENAVLVRVILPGQHFEDDPLEELEGLARTAGTPYEAHYKNKILFMEEIGEEPYRIDSMLSQLWLAGRFQECAGIVFGKCSDCDAEGPNSLTLETLLRDRLGYLGIPVLSGLMFGHISDQTTLPIGCEAELDVEAGTLTLLEAGVRNS